MLKKCLLFAVLVSLVVFASASFAAPEYTWKISHVRPAGASVDKDIHWLAEKLAKDSDGRIELKVFPASQLGDYGVVQERVSLGAIEMAVQPFLPASDQAIQLVNLPYLVNNWDGVRKNYLSGTPFMNWMSEILAKQDIKIVAVWPVYFGGIATSKEPVEPGNPEVSKGLKLRVPPAKSFELMAEAMNYQPTPLPFAEAFTAIQTGIVDGAVGSGAEGYYSNFRDVIKYYIPANTHFEQWFLIMNAELWDELSDEDKKIVSEAGKAFEERRISMMEAETAEQEKKLEDYGIKILRPSDEELNAIAQKVQEKVWPVVREIVGEKVFDEGKSKIVH